MYVLYTLYVLYRELDELEREDFTRLKMVKKKKEEQIKLDEAAKQLKRQQDDEAAIQLSSDRDGSPPVDLSPGGKSPGKNKKKGKKNTQTQYQSKQRESTPGGVVGRSPQEVSSARQRGMDDLEDDNDDVVFN